MAKRKQFTSIEPVSEELTKALKDARERGVSDEELQQQRVSFAFGNAPESEYITRSSVIQSAQRIRLKGDD